MSHTLADGGGKEGGDEGQTPSHPTSTSSPPSSSSFPPTRISVGSYEVHVAINVWKEQWPTIIRQLSTKAAKYVLLTDSNLDPLYGGTLRDKLKELGLDVLYMVLPPGEQTKCRETKAMIEDWMFSHSCGRDTVMLALGGGVMGDLVGYVASGYMRGIPFFQLPTSFLAMVDSSIGGKTGIDTPAGKNLLGAFHRPLAVLIDLALLKTLPQRELCNGMSESIKAGLIADGSLFELFEQHADDLLKKKDLPLLAEVVQRSVAIKARVVLQDEHEAGLRAILNFGHSIGHAIEAFMQPQLLHGECVAIGMMEEIILARGYGLVGSGELRRVDNVLKAYSLPTKIPSHLSPAALLDKMSVDKKNKNGKKELVLLTAIGEVKSKPAYTTMIPDEDLKLLLSEAIGLHTPAAPVRGSLAVPGSKSLSNRILLLAALGRGPCVLTGLLHSQDTQVMLDSLTQLGVKYSWQQGMKQLRIEGCEGRLRLPSHPLFLNNAGTASRFLTTVACMIPNGEVTLTGNARMAERPIKDLVSALQQSCGVQVEYVGKNSGCLPIRITGNGVGLKGGRVKLAANVSSQYVSSILLSAPHAQGEDLVLELDTSSGKGVVSKPFIDMTIQLMRKFGIQVEEEQPFVYRVARGAYDNPPAMQVEGDASSATYPLALAAVTGGEVTVTNVGSDSLQGDARFCRDVLEAMGCTVTQTADSTTVRGPDPSKGESLRALDIDMDHLTDTFMTLAAISAFAHGTTRITNVANQRVKECNRLAVMVEGLIKCGIKATETETGMNIEGVGNDTAAVDRLRAHIARTSSEAIIRCHDDHRIAMSFSLVASRLGECVIIDEKRCVDKTYPEYWEDLNNIFGIKLFAPEEEVMEKHKQQIKREEEAAASSSSSSSSSPSVILIGMRGSGKSTLGRHLATHLRRPFMDLDTLLEEEVGCSLKELVEKEGWGPFREKELAMLQRVLKEHGSGYVISCGGGIVETPAALSLLQSQPLVVQIHRHIDDVVSYLDQDKVRPSFDAREVWGRRKELYQQAAGFEFVIEKGDQEWKKIEKELCHMVDGILSSHSAHTRVVVPSPNTFFLSLTLPTLSSLGQDFTAAKTQMDTLTRGVDAIEVRGDLIIDAASATHDQEEEKVRTYLTTLRRLSRLPIIFTLRSIQQGGKFPNYDRSGSDASLTSDQASTNEHAMVRLLLLAMRLGVECIDVEAALSQQARNKIFSLRDKLYPHVAIISSHHEARSNGGSSVEAVKQLYAKCMQATPSGASPADVLKVVIMAREAADAFRLMQASAEFQTELARTSSSIRPPALISLAMGAAGQVSRVYNSVWTPVTHPSLPTRAAPGQLSVQEIMEARLALGLAPFDQMGEVEGQKVKEWLLFGSPITHSPSPLMHNTAFVWLGLAPHCVYGKLDTTSIEAVKTALQQPKFGGANVTIPLKEEVVPLLDSVSEAVNKIGATNTIIKRADGTLHGENTDWQGIHVLIRSRLPRSPPAASDVSVVLGAGGTARAAIYALLQMGFTEKQVLVYNPRTSEKAHTLAKHFGVRAVDKLTRADISQATGLQQFSLTCIASTLPGSAGYQLEDAALLEGQSDKPVLFEASYTPADTPLIVQCQQQFGLPAANIIRGLDLLLAQGFFGLELWMGKKLPHSCREVIEQKVREEYWKKNGGGQGKSTPIASSKQ